RVVLPRRRRFEMAPAGDAGPLAVQIDVERVVDEVHEARSTRAASDLSEDGLSFRGEVPLHVGEAVTHPERLENAPPESQPTCELGLREIADGDRDGADPLERARLEWLGDVLDDVLHRGSAADGHRVVGEFFAVDVLLAACLR